MLTIVEGTPGAGKTTYLGTVLLNGCRTGAPPVIWPEAQPLDRHRAAGFSAGATSSLLHESVHRVRMASRYDAESYSDRSYLTVLALRYALERQGLLPAGTYQESVSLCAGLGLPELHGQARLILFQVSPEESVERRAAGVVARGEAVWWNRSVLDDMNAWYAENLSRFFRGQVVPQPAADSPGPERVEVSGWEGPLVAGRTCTRCGSECRSGTGVWKGRELALFSRGLHVRDDDGPRCYSGSTEILEWHRRRRGGT